MKINVIKMLVEHDLSISINMSFSFSSFERFLVQMAAFFFVLEPEL